MAGVALAWSCSKSLRQRIATSIQCFTPYPPAYWQHPHAWIGLSFKAAQENKAEIEDAIRAQDNSGWHVVAMDINWEDAALYCAHSNDRIESAYAGD